MITIDDFSKVEIRVGTVLEAIKVPEADRLIKLIFDFGPLENVILSESEGSSQEDSGFKIQDSGKEDSSPAVQNDKVTILPELAEKYPGRHVRQIMSAIAPFFPDPSVLVGKQICVVTNLEPRKFKGYESQGMIMATDDENGIVLIGPERTVVAGAKIH